MGPVQRIFIPSWAYSFRSTDAPVVHVQSTLRGHCFYVIHVSVCIVFVYPENSLVQLNKRTRVPGEPDHPSSCSLLLTSPSSPFFFLLLSLSPSTFLLPPLLSSSFFSFHLFSFYPPFFFSLHISIPFTFLIPPLLFTSFYFLLSFLLPSPPFIFFIPLLRSYFSSLFFMLCKRTDLSICRFPRALGRLPVKKRNNFP